MKKRLVDASAIFIDATHIKANANKKKHRKVMAEHTDKVYEKQIIEELNKEERLFIII